MSPTWISRVGIVALVVGLFLTSYSLVAAAADRDDRGTPFAEILNKLDQILSAVTSATSADLSGVTQNWDKVLTGTARFTVLADFNNAAVRDNETGLVWETSPGTATMTWSSARSACADKNVGGRKGWRLPSFPELASLVDPSVAVGPALPPGHPFTNVQSIYYWSASTGAEFPAGAWAVMFDVAGTVQPNGKTAFSPVWCVRGGMTVDMY